MLLLVHWYFCWAPHQGSQLRPNLDLYGHPPSKPAHAGCITAVGSLWPYITALSRLSPPYGAFSGLAPPLPTYTGFIQMRAAKSTSVGVLYRLLLQDTCTNATVILL